MAISKRGSDEDLFSISGASEALGRARRTISHAMKGVAPDALRHGLSLWRMQKIIEMVNTRTKAPILTTNTEGALTQLCADASEAFQEFDNAWEQLMKLKTLAARRAATRKLVPLLKTVCETMLSRDLADNLHPEHAELRSQSVYRLSLRGFEHHCQWSPNETWDVFNSEPDQQSA